MTLSSDEPTTAPDDQPGFEEALRRLEAIVQALEEGDLGLAEALTQYEMGVKLLKQCYGLLEHAERRIELLSGFDAEGKPLTERFDDAPASLEEKVTSRGRRRSKPQTPTSPIPEPSPPQISDIDEPGALF